MTRTRSDSGESLIEILISITILGIAVSALLFGMGTAATTSGLHTRQSQQAESLRNVVSAVGAAAYSDCATSYTSAVPSGLVPAGYAVTALVVAYASGASFTSGCPSPDQGAQKVRVTVTQPDARVLQEQVTVVKRRPCETIPC